MTAGRGHHALLGLALAGVVVAVACFSEHSDSTTAPGTSALCSLPLGPGVGGSTLIAIRDFSFQANDVRITAGTSVTWLNCEPAGTPSHTSTSDAGGLAVAAARAGRGVYPDLRFAGRLHVSSATPTRS